MRVDPVDLGSAAYSAPLQPPADPRRNERGVFAVPRAVLSWTQNVCAASTFLVHHSNGVFNLTKQRSPALLAVCSCALISGCAEIPRAYPPSPAQTQKSQQYKEAVEEDTEAYNVCVHTVAMNLSTSQESPSDIATTAVIQCGTQSNHYLWDVMQWMSLYGSVSEAANRAQDMTKDLKTSAVEFATATVVTARTAGRTP